MKETFLSLREFQDEDHARRRSQEEDFGTQWTLKSCQQPWRVSHIIDTGEVYAVLQDDGPSPVILLGRRPPGPEYPPVSHTLEGWESHQNADGIDWIREQLARTGPSLQEQYGQLAELNQEQRLAATTVDGPVLIVAGPGSGKTRVITHRILHLVQELSVSPDRIIAVTFTNRAASEMRQRLDQMLGQNSRALTIQTFHKFCGRTLRQYGHEIGLRPDYTIYDADDQLVVVEQAMALTGVLSEDFKSQDILRTISNAKARMLTPDSFAQSTRATSQDQNEQDPDNPETSENKEQKLHEASALVYTEYQDTLEANNALDFDDMLLKTVQLLEQSRPVQESLHRRYHHLMVDEFQDTNYAQYCLTSLLAGPRQNVCVVGDPDQSIYRWRGADIQNILDFQKDFPNTTLVRLGQNYRSTGAILEAASQLIGHNPDRIQNPLRTDNSWGEHVEFLHSQDEQHEAERITAALIGVVKNTDASWRDCAVTYRTNAQSRALEEICVKRNIPYRLVGGIRFYHRLEIKNILAYLKLLLNPQDNINLRRIINIPPRGIGSKTLQKLSQHAEQNGCNLLQSVDALSGAWPLSGDSQGMDSRAVGAISRFQQLFHQLRTAHRQNTVTQLLDYILDITGLGEFIQNSQNGPDRWNNVQEFRSLTLPYGQATEDNGLAAFLEQVSLTAEADEYNPEEGSLTLITLHQAKGLEFKAVAIAGMEEGLLPHQLSEELQEERRLCYVGITRARERLFISWADRRHYRYQSPSRFLDEIDPQQLEETPGLEGFRG